MLLYKIRIYGFLLLSVFLTSTHYSMSTENLISLQLTSEEQARLQAAIGELQDVLQPKLASLSPEQRVRLPKMGDSSEPFVEKALDYARANPEFMPPYMEAAELQTDFEAVKSLNTVYRPLEQLLSQLDDSRMLSGSEAYTAALAYYQSVKLAARMNIGGAKAIYDDLRSRFKDNGRRNGEG